MTGWILENLGTIGISLLLIIIVTEIILGLIKNKKLGRSTCGGNCAHCKMCASCGCGRSGEPAHKT